MPDSHPLYPATSVHQHQRWIAPAIAWGTLLLMMAAACVDILLTRGPARFVSSVVRVAPLAVAAAALIVGIGRARGRARIADAFFPLVLLNPFLYSYRAHPSDSLHKTLLATGILGLMTAAIVAMRRNNLLRYLAVAGLALALTLVSSSFLMLLPALLAWYLYTGYLLARAPVPAERRRGVIILALGEILLLFFGIACILEAPAAPPLASSLFQTIVGFTNFPLIVLAIILLALGWHTGPHGTTSPHFAGMLALLVGLLTLLLNDFQAGKLPPPGTDQSVLLLCIVYTVSALHGPRRIQWLLPPALLLAALLYTIFQ